MFIRVVVVATGGYANTGEERPRLRFYDNLDWYDSRF